MKRSPRERFRLALRLLRQYERDEANEKTAAESLEIIHRFNEQLAQGGWSPGRGRTGAESWREAVAAKGITIR